LTGSEHFYHIGIFLLGGVDALDIDEYVFFHGFSIALFFVRRGFTVE
jgi:hypothetical protein